jgi:SnoaL-like protein
MESSQEVGAILTSLMETFGSPAMAKTFLDTISDEPGTLIIGSDPGEWWDDQDQIRRVMTAQGEELEGMVAKVVHSEGWVERDVGWGAGILEATGPGGQPTTLRITATFTRRADSWKIVQAHVSIGISNEEAIGKELTV